MMLTRFLRFISLLPLMTVASFVGVVCGARYTLGRWPTPMLDDPKQIEGGILFDNLMGMLGLSFALMVITAPIWLFVGATNAKAYKRHLCFVAVGWIMLIVIGYNDPGHYLEWLGD